MQRCSNIEVSFVTAFAQLARWTCLGSSAPVITLVGERRGAQGMKSVSAAYKRQVDAQNQGEGPSEMRKGAERDSTSAELPSGSGALLCSAKVSRVTTRKEALNLCNSVALELIRVNRC